MPLESAVRDEAAFKGESYELVSIRPAKPPPGTSGADWYRYDITQGRNKMHGYRHGSLQAVTRAVEEIVFQLNERRIGKRGRVNLIPTPKKKRA